MRFNFINSLSTDFTSSCQSNSRPSSIESVHESKWKVQYLSPLAQASRL